MRTPAPATIRGLSPPDICDGMAAALREVFVLLKDWTLPTCDGVLARRWAPVFWLQPHPIDIVAQEAVVGVQPGLEGESLEKSL